MHVYVASAGDDAVAAFAREADTGALHFVEAERDGVGGVNGLDSARSIAVSPDGKNLYVAGPGDDAVAAFARDAASGALQFVEAERDGVGGVDGLDSAASVAVSGDGLYVYATGAPDDKVAVFARNVATGALAFIEGESRAIDDPRSLAASPDGKNLYVANAADNTVAVFGLRASGALRYEESLPAMVGTPDSPIRLITVSPEGKYVYVSGTLGTTVYSRSGATGLLTLVDDVGRLLAVDPESISVSPDGRQVYFAGSDGLKVARVRDE
jgi:DNA-binding beta-propeller fold protein YncE